MPGRDRPRGLTRDQLLQIAAEVERGDRPRSDLKKYGITIGPAITGEKAKAMLLAELDAEAD